MILNFDECAHVNYLRVAEVARIAHAANRSLSGIAACDIDLARLYSYGFRSQAIGTFHATRQALLRLPPPSLKFEFVRKRAVEALGDLINLAMESIPTDFRAVLITFYRYHETVSRLLESLSFELEEFGEGLLPEIIQLFTKNILPIIGECGIYVTSDIVVPEQNGFIVPGLGIVIIPLIYGDHHSWNVAHLSMDVPNVPAHRHLLGAEIHLGYSPLNGDTLLGEAISRVTTGYAMPIPAGIVHGWFNRSTDIHHVPFIFGSLRLGGWGIFQDVLPESTQVDSFATVERDSKSFEHMAYLEKEINDIARSPSMCRKVIVNSSATWQAESGGLELAVVNTGYDYLNLKSDSFRIVSIVRGKGEVFVAGEERSIKERDHFGIPAGMEACVRSANSGNLVLLETLMRI